MNENSPIKWIPISVKPTGIERRMLVWVKWPEVRWPSYPGPAIAWWKNGPKWFYLKGIENADHLITHWSEINQPE